MTLTLIVTAAAFLVFAGLALGLLVRSDRQRRRHLARLKRVRPDTAVQLEKPQRGVLDKHRKFGLVGRIEQELAKTSLRSSVNEIFIQVFLAAIGIYGLGVILGGLHPLTALPLAILLPVGGAVLVLRIARNRYRAAFTADLPEALDVFARGLRAGRPVSDSLSIVVANAKGPIQYEFSRCHDEITMGTTLPDSLARLELRIPTAEVSFFSVATSLQAETGGNLIETMEGLANQLRERRKLRKKARALSSEARASALILALLPFAVTLAIAVLNGAYLEPLYADPRGRMISLIALGSITLGVFIMARMGKLDV
ncbi:type II secretion system F family protein [Sulfitobacter sp. HGT1]|uniref:type II secretion system F family protein n=1 Tax=Sulfitobacter sp. HGT1 TaxID=2735435 RepID=UPI00159323FD|nr:type II secretion system F family protein [Sulfitobacter sp. HGT1]